ncbi:MAG: hypothetical protein HFJ34_05270 [Clostridia bacterium]|nr:hypothetical protein [Clostridia bacterium]
MPNDIENVADESLEELKVEDTTNKEETSEKTFTQEEVDRVVSQEKARFERKHRKEEESKLSKFKKLENVLRAGLSLSDEDDVLSKVEDFYKEQGIDIPDNKSVNKKDAEILGVADAQEIIETFDDTEIEARANELADKQSKGKTSARENAEFFKLGEYLTSKLKEKELETSGIDVSILQDKGFKEFANKFNSNMKMSEIYELWEKVNESIPKKPVSTGSSKSTVPNNQIKEYYTPDEVDKLSSKDLDNPTIFERVRESMKRW